MSIHCKTPKGATMLRIDWKGEIKDSSHDCGVSTLLPIIGMSFLLRW
ncbi:hypothetical protein ES708_02311 [subsurface metagenome]